MEILWILISLYLLLSFIFFHVAFNRKIKKTFIRRSRDIKYTDYSFMKADQAWFLEKKPTERWIRHQDLDYHAYHLEVNKDQATVILVHGFSSQGLAMAVFAKQYYEDFNYNLLLIDLSGHGQSTGTYIQYGYGEKELINAWVNTLKEDGYKDQFYLHGVSMGAATLLFSQSTVLDSSIKGMICDAPYTDMLPIFKRQVKKIFKLSDAFILPGLNLWMKLYLGFTANDLSLQKHLKQLSHPTLIIHGLKDLFVPYQQSINLKAQFPSIQLELFEHSEHVTSLRDETKRYHNLVKNFILDNQ